MLDPVRRAGYRPLPQAVVAVAVGLSTLGQEHPLAAAQGPQLLHVPPEAAAQARQCRRAEGRSLHHLRPVHGDAQQIRLHLQQDVRHAGAAVGPQHGDVAAGVLPHGQHQVRDLIGDALQHGTGQMAPIGTAGDAQHRAAGVHVPIGRAQPREGRYHHHAAAVRHRGRQPVDLRRGADDAQLVPQPLDGAASVKDAALQSVGGLAAHLPRHRGHKARAAAHRRITHVHQGKAAGAVCIFGFAGSEAGLAEQSGLLIAGGAANRHSRQLLQPLDTGAHRAVYHAVGHRLGQHGHGHAQYAAKLLVPAQAVDVKEHGAAGVGVICNVLAGELPDEPGLHRAEQHLPPLRPLADARDVVQYPADLAAGEIGVDQQARGGLDALVQSLPLQVLAQLRRPAALPDDGVVYRLARGLVPEDGGLPLVGNADTGDAALRKARDSLCRGQTLRLPDLHGVVLYPAVLGIVLGKGVLRHGRNAALPVENDGPGAGGPLIQRQDVIGHGFSSFLFHFSVVHYDHISLFMDYTTKGAGFP